MQEILVYYIEKFSIPHVECNDTVAFITPNEKKENNPMKKNVYRGFPWRETESIGMTLYVAFKHLLYIGGAPCISTSTVPAEVENLN